MQENDILELSEQLRAFFLVVDGFLIENETAEEALEQLRDSLEEGIRRKEGAMVVITALGGRYNGAIDRAKLKEVEALLALIRARKELRVETLRDIKLSEDANASLRALFGIEVVGYE